MPSNNNISGSVQLSQPSIREPIAIIGIGCRFPGDANSPEDFWKLLTQGVNAITPVPQDRWHIRAFYNPDPVKPGKTYVRFGGFIKDIDLFDAGFFGISPREASRMDPQQRLLLEVAFEALEDGGISPERIAGSNTGVFIGISTSDYGGIQTAVSERRLISAYTNIGLGLCISANRISYLFDFHGPSFAVDTACSSSLVAAHLACQSIWNGECEMALTGGVNAILRPEGTIGFSKASMLSPTGSCKSFDAGADGYVRAEGAGVIVLKPLAKALNDGDPIYSVIRGTAINQDGRTGGIAFPNRLAQESILKEVYEQAGILPEQVHYIEAHGTGTSAGDPVEINAIGNALTKNRPPGNECLVGSVKTNIGHLEAASGIAGLIKVALALKHGKIPKNLHFETPNPEIDFEGLKIRVPLTMEPWPENGRDTRFAGVNSFGFGGTNAHIILEFAPDLPKSKPLENSKLEEHSLIFPISARSSEALQAFAKSYIFYLTSKTPSNHISLSDICYSASLRRGHHDHRLSVVAGTKEELAEHLEAFLIGETRVGMSSERRIPGKPHKLAFVFPGMGPQWWAMGRELLKEEPVFKEAIKQCDTLMKKHANWSLWDELTANEDRSRINETQIAQPAIFSIQVALSALWSSWGIKPDVVLGHSVGEVAAAHVAGALSLEDAVQVIFHRSRLQQRTAGQGAMLAVGLTFEEAESLIEGYEERVSIGAVNSPSDITLSGDAETLKKFAESLEKKEIFSRFLHVEVPYHSPKMEPLKAELLESLKGIRPQRVAIPLFSTVTGQQVEGLELEGAYWSKNIRDTVLFANAIDRLIKADYNLFLEIGPHPVLAASISKCLTQAKKEGTVMHSLRRQEPERTVLVGSFGRLYTLGYPIDWNQFYPNGGQFVKLPPYPWQRERYWHESKKSQQERLGQKVHPLLGNPLESANAAWIVELDKTTPRYLEHHRVQESVMYPGSAYVEMALAAARESFSQDACVLEDIMLQRSIIMPDKEQLTVQLSLDSGKTTFEISTHTGNSGQSWIHHATGKLRVLQEEEQSEPVRVDKIRWRCKNEIGKGKFYQTFQDMGIQYGDYFQGVERLWYGKREALGKVELHPDLETEVQDYLLHPTVLDSCFQVILGAMVSEGVGEVKGVYLPVQIERVRFHSRPGFKLYSHVLLTERDATHIKADIELLDDAGNVLAEIQGFRCQFVPTASDKVDSYLYEYKWKLTAREGQALLNRSADHIHSPIQITRRLKSEAKRLSRELGREKYYESFEPQLRVLANAYILNAFQRLGWRFSTRRTVSLDSLVTMLRVGPQHQRLFERLLQILEADGTLKKVGGKWKFSKLPKIQDPQKIWKSLWLRFPAYLAELTLIWQCGEKLPEVLRGEVDPLGIILPQGSLTTLEHLYQDSPSYRVYNLLVQKAVAMALDTFPEGRIMRILEIGGGTGGMTSYVLRKLPLDRTEYVFTDVTQLFLNHAEQKFHDYPFVRYQVLDIEKDPIKQGFEAHSFDMILASDVLHATRDLGETLARVKRLLASEGLLILLEGMHTTVGVILVFGLLKGWWLFDDDLRKNDPWISQKAWQNLLEEEGFTEIASLTDTEKTDSALHSVIMAKGPIVKMDADSEEAINNLPEKQGSWLVFADRKGVGKNLAERLKDIGENPILISPGEKYRRIDDNHYQICPGNSDDIKKAVHESLNDQSECRGVLHLWSLDIPSTEEPTLYSLEKSNHLGSVSVLHLVQVLTSAEWSDFPHLFFVTNGAERVIGSDKSPSVTQAPIWGFTRVIRNEYPNIKCKVVDLSPNTSPEEIDSLYKELWSENDEDEIALRGKTRYSHILTRVSLQKIQKEAVRRYSVKTNKKFSLDIITPGILDSLTLRSLDRRKPGPREVEIEIQAAALNFKDVMISMGLLPDEALERGYTGKALGMEGAGRITALGRDVKGFKKGDEVIVCGPGVMRTHVIMDASFVMKKPKHLSFEEAATIPIAFLTAYYSLHHLGGIRKGDRILIHAAMGGVGLAAIQLAQRAGAEVFATAGSAAKRDLLKALGVQHVMNSRSLAFGDEVMEITKGMGVNIVINSLSGEAIQKSLSVLSSYGRFIEIGKRDIYENNKLGLRPFRNNLTYSAVDLDRLCAERPEVGRELLLEVMKFFEDKKFSPLPHRVFPISEIVSAFRYMAQAKHIGKVVVSFQDSQVDVTPPTPKPFKCREDGTYLITGGLSGFGLATAKWMVERGAKHLVLMGRRGASTEEAVTTIDKIKKAGVKVFVAKANVTKRDQVAKVLGDIRKRTAPLRGVIHAAMVLDDAILLQLNEERMRKVMAPKIIGAWNLHAETINIPLDLFVLFSSFSSIIGSPGQGNYAAGNVFLDSLAHYRRLKGLPVLTINWGGISDVGYVANNPEVAEKLEHIGMKSLPSEVCLRILGELLQRGAVQVGVGNLDWQQLSRVHVITPTQRFAHLVEANLSEEGDGSGALLIDTIMDLKPEERRQHLESFICERLARILGTSPSKLDVNQPLLGLGIDSLMAVEIGNQIQMGLGVNVPTVKFMEGLSISGLSNYVIEQLDAKGSSPDSKINKKDTPVASEKKEEVSDKKADLPLDKLPVEKIYLETVSSPQFPLLALQTNGSKQPLFLMHPIGGNVFCYGKLSRYLGKEQPFYAIQSPGLDGQKKPLARIDYMADQYISSIQSVQNKGPYLLGGWSMGGMVAFEMAQKLKEKGEKVSLLALIDIQKIAHDKAEPESVAYFFTSLVRDVGLPLDDNDTLIVNYILQLESDKKWKNFMDLVKDDSADKGVKELLRKLAVYFGLTTDQVIFLLNRYYEIGQDKLMEHISEFVEFVSRETLNVKSSQTQRRLQVYFNNHLASRDYKPKIYQDPVVNYMPSEEIGRNNRDSISGWKKFFAGGMEIHKVPGDHYTMLDEPNVRTLAEKLNDCIERA